MYALNATSGSVEWEQPSVQATYPPGLDATGVLYTTQGLDVAAYNYLGNSLWVMGNPGRAPCVPPSDVLFLASGATLTALSTTYGDPRWTLSLSGDAATDPALSPDGSLVLMATTTHVLAVTAVDTDDAQVWWSVPLNTSLVGTPGTLSVGGDGSVYVLGTKALLCMDGSSGATRWVVPVGKSPPSALALGTHGLLYLATANAVLAVDGTSGHQVWSVEAVDAGPTPLTVAAGDVVLYVVTDTVDDQYVIIALEGETGSRLWAYALTVFPMAGNAVALVPGPGLQLVLVTQHCVYSVTGEWHTP